MCHYFPATENIAVDSTGASDSFISALASYLSKGYPTEAAIQIAIQAAGFSVSKEGVIDSLVDHVTLENYLIKKRTRSFLLIVTPVSTDTGVFLLNILLFSHKPMRIVLFYYNLLGELL